MGMKFHDMIQTVQSASDFSDTESKDALEMMVESLAVHLPERERREFAEQLPEELRDIALSVMATEENSRMDILKQFMLIEHISRARAKRQITCAWRALKRAVDITKLERIKVHIPRTSLALLT
jgi:uncharacterized protein (DUF2267 family)